VGREKIGQPHGVTGKFTGLGFARSGGPAFILGSLVEVPQILLFVSTDLG
jgi:hypothetical protein